MFRGKSAMNGEGQTGGAPPSTTSALLSRNRTEQNGQGGQDVACDQLLQREEAGLCHFRGSQDRRGVSFGCFPDGKADLPRWG